MSTPWQPVNPPPAPLLAGSFAAYNVAVWICPASPRRQIKAGKGKKPMSNQRHTKVAKFQILKPTADMKWTDLGRLLRDAQYRVFWAGKFLDQWCTRTMRSKIEPMKKVAGSLREHRDLILNWFRARGTVSAGAVEGLNNKAKLTTRKAYGFRTCQAIEIALYHTLGKLPEPKFTHEFW